MVEMPKDLQFWDIESLQPYERNSRQHSAEQVERICQSMKEFGFTNPILVDGENGIIAGHGRLEAAKKLGLKEVPVIQLGHLSEQQKRAYIIADNKLAELSSWDDAMLKSELSALQDLGYNIELTGFSNDFLLTFDDMPTGESEGEGGDRSESSSEGSSQKLADKFGVVPFTVLNAREGWWQQRKKSWLDLGIKSEVGRGANLLGMSDTMLEPDAEKRKAKALAGAPSNYQMIPGYYDKIDQGMTKEQIIAEYEASGSSVNSGTSIFDPVLCELAYRWFAPKDGVVVDPFAGGSVRGIVAGKLGRTYHGVELRKEQVEANREQAKELVPEGDVHWHNADSRTINDVLKGKKADFIFSCPPYADLEVYSDDPQDLSTLDYPEFKKAYFEIIEKACKLLKNDRFACFVVGDVRDKKGNYYNFVGDTVEAFRAAGLEYYNEAILVTAVGTLALRAGRTFAASRKLGKTHQNILVFVKGNAKKAVEALGECEFGDFQEAEATTVATDYGEKLTADSLAGEV